MHLKSFLKFVELPTKIASVVPFLFGILYTLFRFNTLKPLHVLFFFIAMLSFDMFTTGLNNYMDHKRAIKKEGYNYETHNGIVQYNLKESTILITLAVLFLSASVFGLLTFLNSDWIVLLLGAMSFVIGILYSAGPIPISRTPLGEIFSGFFMGIIIPFLTVYISIYDQQPISLLINWSNFVVTLHWQVLLSVILVSAPAMFCIANIMLANNICDVEDDFTNKRYTLPIQIGRNKALIVYDALYILSYIDIILCIIFGYLPIFSLLVFVFVFKLYKNLKAFHKLQTKKDTFILAVQNFVIIMVPLILSLFVGYLFNLFY